MRYALKTPYRDGTTHMVLESPDLMVRLSGGFWPFCDERQEANRKTA